MDKSVRIEINEKGWQISVGSLMDVPVTETHIADKESPTGFKKLHGCLESAPEISNELWESLFPEGKYKFYENILQSLNSTTQKTP